MGRLILFLTGIVATLIGLVNLLNVLLDTNWVLRIKGAEVVTDMDLVGCLFIIGFGLSAFLYAFIIGNKTMKKGLKIFLGLLPLFVLGGFIAADAIERQMDYNEFYESGREKWINEDLEGALTDFNKAIEQDSIRTEFYLSRSNVLTDLGRIEEALSDLNTIIELEKEPYFFYTRAFLYLDHFKDTTKACADYNKSIELGFDLEKYSRIKMEFCK